MHQKISCFIFLCLCGLLQFSPSSGFLAPRESRVSYTYTLPWSLRNNDNYKGSRKSSEISQRLSWFLATHGGGAGRSQSQSNERGKKGERALIKVGPGSYVALVTPFNPHGGIHVTALRELLRWHLASGTDGIVILGTTGEAAVMSEDEKKLVMAITKEEIGGKLPIIVGTGTIDPTIVIKQCRLAQEYGADACLVVTPYYLKSTQKGLIATFEKIAESSPLPIILYNVPGRTGVDMAPETVAELSKHPNIIGCKEATGDNSRVSKIQKLAGKDFLLYSGDDAGAMEFVFNGGHGVISVTANLAPKAMHEVMKKAYLKQDMIGAARINKPLEGLHDKLFCEPNPIPVKWALWRMGLLKENSLRLPLTWLEEKSVPQMEKAMGDLLP